MTKILPFLHVDAATIRLLDPTRQKLVLEAASGLSDTYLKRGPIDAEESVISALAGTPQQTEKRVKLYVRFCEVAD